MIDVEVGVICRVCPTPREFAILHVPFPSKRMRPSRFADERKDVTNLGASWLLTFVQELEPID